MKYYLNIQSITVNDNNIVHFVYNERDDIKELQMFSNSSIPYRTKFRPKKHQMVYIPEYVVNKINELKSELNLQNLQVWSNFPGMNHEDCMRSIKLFNDEVIPKINPSKPGLKQAS